MSESSFTPITRFEIQDIAAQNEDGITFRALDKSLGQIVSLRRFFPYGQDEEGETGLSPQEGAAFSSACQQLSHISHPALRKTIYGDTDPVDGMPYLVTEWIDGASLADVLEIHSMDSHKIIGIIRQALDVSMVLSNALENEAVWINATTESIIVGNLEEYSSFSFKICPYKWLGIKSRQRDLTGIADLTESLIGQQSKYVNECSDMRLTEWLKLLRQHPDIGLHAALESLPSQDGEYEIEAATNTCDQPVIAPVLTNANLSAFNRKSLILMAISACVTVALVIFFYQNKERRPASGLTIPNGVHSAQTAAPVIFSPENVEGIAEIKSNQPASVRGVVKTLSIRSPGSGLYVSFLAPSNKQQIGVVFYPKSFEGGPYHHQDFLKIEENLQKLVGKTVTFSGVVTRHIGKSEPHYIRIDKNDQIIMEAK
jgi:hypothetical protein